MFATFMVLNPVKLSVRKLHALDAVFKRNVCNLHALNSVLGLMFVIFMRELVFLRVVFFFFFLRNLLCFGSSFYA